jgi:DNA polymerase-3 subunit alpha (Gram-positive type)
MKEHLAVEDVIGCRDDIMQYLMGLGMQDKKAFKIMEGVRKGRGLTNEQEEDMLAVNVPDWYIESCRKIKYLFPKAHAAAYVMMAARIAWFKIHRPAEYYAAYFSVRAGAFDISVMSGGADAVKRRMKQMEQDAGEIRKLKGADETLYIALEVCLEMWNRGIAMGSVDFFRSDATRFKLDGTALIPPFTAVNGLGDAAASELAERRSQKEEWTIEELAASCSKVSNSHVEELKRLGAFGDMPLSAQMSWF